MFKILTALMVTLILSACTPLMYFPRDGSAPVTFSSGDPAPALVLYHDRADLRGWTAEEIAVWEPFSLDVWSGESGFCPNIRRGASLVGDGSGCIIARQGPHSDSGIAQVLMGYPNRKGWLPPFNGGSWSMHENAVFLCPEEGLCTPSDVVATPEASMDAYLALVEHAGKGPWCFNAWARSYHPSCKSAPSTPPNVDGVTTS